jgi:hypothetical protein
MLSLTGQVPVQALAATYSHRDWRLWIVEQTAEGPILIRINPMTGAVVSAGGNDALGDLTEVWLTTLDDGRVLLSGNLPDDRHRLAVLEATPFADAAEVTLVSLLDLDGVLAMAPAVRQGLITCGREVLVNERSVIEPTLVSVAELLP